MELMSMEEIGRVTYETYAKLRDARGMNDGRVAKALGLERRALSDWKLGKATPKADKLMLIADYFGVSVDYLLGRDKR